MVGVGVTGCEEKSQDAKDEVELRLTEFERLVRLSWREVSGGRSSEKND